MRRACRAAVAVAVMLAGSQAHAAAPPPADGAPIYLPLAGDADLPDAHLDGLPSNDDMAREYPRIAKLMGISGRASMTCKALTTGRLDDCHVVSENPDGMGFGAATVRIAVYFHVRAAQKDGKPADGVITIPVQWRMDEEDLPAPLPALAPVAPAALALGRQVVELEGVAGQIRTGWRPVLQQQMAELAADGDAQAGQSVTDAFQLGLDDAIGAEVERQAHEMAAHLSEADLKATASFLQSPAGKAWAAARAQSLADEPKDFVQRVGLAARAHLCGGKACPAAGAPLASR